MFFWTQTTPLWFVQRGASRPHRAELVLVSNPVVFMELWQDWIFLGFIRHSYLGRLLKPRQDSLTITALWLLGAVLSLWWNGSVWWKMHLPSAPGQWEVAGLCCCLKIWMKFIQSHWLYSAACFERENFKNASNRSWVGKTVFLGSILTQHSSGKQKVRGTAPALRNRHLHFSYDIFFSENEIWAKLTSGKCGEKC